MLCLCETNTNLVVKLIILWSNWWHDVNADWAFSGWAFWQKKKACVLHYSSVSAFSHWKYFLISEYYTEGIQREYYRCCFISKVLTSLWDIHLEISSTEQHFKLPENSCLVLAMCLLLYSKPMLNSYLLGFSLTPCLGVLFFALGCCKMQHALVNVWRCSDRP